MRDRRVNTRYDVSTTNDLEGRTGKSPAGERLVTFSHAGCGFWALLDDAKLKVGDVLQCEFRLGRRDWVKVQGAILYTNPYPMNGQIGRFYGIRFLGDYEKVIRPIISELESWMSGGKITIAQ